MLMETSASLMADVIALQNVDDARTGPVDKALRTIANGGMVIVTDDKSRENEGDLIMAADAVTPADMAFIVRHTTGIVCVAIDDARADALGLPPMVDENTDPHATAFTVTCDAANDITTGVSAADRVATCRILADPEAYAGDLRRPGHVFPLRARRGGVMARMGHTESAYDLARMSGRAAAGVLCELINDDGTMMRGEQIDRFAVRHDLCVIDVASIARWRIFSDALAIV